MICLLPTLLWMIYTYLLFRLWAPSPSPNAESSTSASHAAPSAAASNTTYGKRWGDLGPIPRSVYAMELLAVSSFGVMTFTWVSDHLDETCEELDTDGPKWEFWCFWRVWSAAFVSPALLISVLWISLRACSTFLSRQAALIADMKSYSAFLKRTLRAITDKNEPEDGSAPDPAAKNSSSQKSPSEDEESSKESATPPNVVDLGKSSRNLAESVWAFRREFESTVNGLLLVVAAAIIFCGLSTGTYGAAMKGAIHCTDRHVLLRVDMYVCRVRSTMSCTPAPGLTLFAHRCRSLQCSPTMSSGGRPG